LNLRKEKAFWFGIYETWVQRVMCEVLLGGGRVWDVGACFGYHTLLMCKLCGPRNVLAIEPDVDNQLRLTDNLKRNGFESTSVASTAVGAAPGRLFLRRHSSDPGQSVAESFGENEVGVTTLDILSNTHAPPDLIKVDIEGAENLMLQGASRFLQEVRPIWIMEVHGKPGEEAMELLRIHGYRVTGFGKGHEFAFDFPVGGPRHVLAEP
jgi:FkbM family methyltransferase